MKRWVITAVLATAMGLAAMTAMAQPYQNMMMAGRDAREMFYSDTLNKYMVYRPYPEPTKALTPAPKGYKPVYISSYQRHGSRKLHRDSYSQELRRDLSAAAAVGALTPLGAQVLSKTVLVDEDLKGSVGELTALGQEQHRRIAERMYRNFKPVFASDGAQVRCWSTVVQRTMMSMFSCIEGLMEQEPGLDVRKGASHAFTWLNNGYKSPNASDLFEKPYTDFITEYVDVRPVLSRLFLDGAPELPDTVRFINNLYVTAAIIPGLDIKGVDFYGDLFSGDGMLGYVQAMNYQFYSKMGPSPYNEGVSLESQKPLLRDIIQRADAALASGVPGADLRFGHDSFLTPLIGLMGVNNYCVSETDPLKVMDVFQDFAVTPMAGNVQVVFYRNKAGNVLVKVLQNEIESALPVHTDKFPYYEWSDVRAWWESRLDTDFRTE